MRKVRFAGDRIKSAGPYLALAALLIPSVVWIARDHSVWPWDPAWYGEVSVDLWYALTHSFTEWVRRMLTDLNIKPPGIVWIAQLFVPLRSLVGSVENALLLSLLLTQIVLLWILFKIGETIQPASKIVPFAGAVFAGGTRAFVGLSHEFFPEPLQALAVAWVVLIAAKSRVWPATRTMIHLANALLLGVLAKATTPVYCFLFCAYILVVISRKWTKLSLAAEWEHWPSRCLICSFAAVSPVAAVWYKVNLAAVWQHVREASSGEIALQYGFRASIGRKLLVWIRLLDQSFLSPYLIWSCVAALLLAIAFRFRPAEAAAKGAAGPLLLLSAGQTMVLLVLFSSNDTVDPRYMYAIVVYIAVLLMGFFTFIPSRAAGFVFLALCVFQWSVVNGASLGIRTYLSSQADSPTLPSTDRSPYDEMARVVQRTSATTGRYNIVGVEEPWFNANSAAFFAAKNRLDTGVRSYYTSLGYAEKSPLAAMRRVDTLQTHYLITLDESYQRNPPNFVNIVSLPVLREIKHDGRFQMIPFPSREGVLIFERQEATGSRKGIY
jgi:hypothetical protein